jgi:RimJ/RimL family protein N-acetyltransferase
VSAATIRLLAPSDWETFRSIRLEALRAEPVAFASAAEDWETLSAEEWRGRLAAASVFVAFNGEEPVAIMGLMRQRSGKMAHRATIIMVYVRKSFRGSGIASELLQSVTDHARASGIRQLELAVTAENPGARRFYEREGFAVIGRIPGGFLHDGKEIDEIMMARRIDD